MKEIPDYVLRALKDLKMAIERDHFNLNRDDHDAIDVQLQALKDFIYQRYA